MPLVSFPRSTPTLLQLEDRCTPAIEVWDTAWNAGTEKTLPWAIAQANNSPGQDTITFNFIELGTNRPTFRALAGETVNVTEGVIINAGGGGQYATFTGFRPFHFTHDAKGAAGAGLESAITGGVFHQCGVPVNVNVVEFTDYGGAIQVSGGTLTVANTRFTDNTAPSGGAIAVDTGAKLVVRGLPNVAPPMPTPPDPPNHPGEPPIPEHQASRTLFKDNAAVAGGRGGAIWSLGEVDLGDVWFVGNSAKDGGAIAVVGGKVTVAAPIPPGPIQIGPPAPVSYDIRFLQNTATADGGAVYYRSGNQTSVLDRVLFAGNTSAARGGAIVVLKGTLSLTESKLEANQATAFGPNGAGIHIEGSATTNAKVVATRVKFDNNNGWGGFGVSIMSWGELQTHGCDFSNNNTIWRGIVPGAPGAPPNPIGVYTPDPNDPDVNML